MATLAVNGQQVPAEEVALGCVWAEHNYPGVPCGIMDQMTSTMGRAGHAMLLDCRDRATRHVPLNDPGVRVVISNSNVKHELVGGEYRARRSQCEEAVAKLQSKFPEIRALRDATLAQLHAMRQEMSVLVLQRARHVITEIARTQAFADALERRTYEQCGELMYASHASLRDDYEVSCEELDALVEIARGVPGVYGARMTGGGFGGCIVALCQTGSVDLLTREIASRYPPMAGGRQATTFSTTASQGATVATV
jgi:galactokinase